MTVTVKPTCTLIRSAQGGKWTEKREELRRNVDSLLTLVESWLYSGRLQTISNRLLPGRWQSSSLILGQPNAHLPSLLEHHGNEKAAITWRQSKSNFRFISVHWVDFNWTATRHWNYRHVTCAAMCDDDLKLKRRNIGSGFTRGLCSWPCGHIKYLYKSSVFNVLLLADGGRRVCG